MRLIISSVPRSSSDSVSPISVRRSGASVRWRAEENIELDFKWLPGGRTARKYWPEVTHGDDLQAFEEEKRSIGNTVERPHGEAAGRQGLHRQKTDGATSGKARNRSPITGDGVDRRRRREVRRGKGVPIGPHLDAFKESMGETTAMHVKLTMTRVNAIVAGCKFDEPADINREVVEIYLRSRRKSKENMSRRRTITTSRQLTRSAIGAWKRSGCWPIRCWGRNG